MYTLFTLFLWPMLSFLSMKPKVILIIFYISCSFKTFSHFSYFHSCLFVFFMSQLFLFLLPLVHFLLSSFTFIHFLPCSSYQPGPEPPTNIIFSELTENSLTVSWTKPKSPVSGFKVTYTHTEEGESLASCFIWLFFVLVYSTATSFVSSNNV